MDRLVTGTPVAKQPEVNRPKLADFQFLGHFPIFAPRVRAESVFAPVARISACAAPLIEASVPKDVQFSAAQIHPPAGDLFTMQQIKAPAPSRDFSGGR
jgi:hypothetical protein